MALTTYEISLDWIPDDDFINSNQGIHYLAWQIGRDEKRQLGFWLITPVRDDPEPLENLLPDPEEYEAGELLDDTSKYGYARTVDTKEKIDDVQTAFLAEAATVIDEVNNGYR